MPFCKLTSTIKSISFFTFFLLFGTLNAELPYSNIDWPKDDKAHSSDVNVTAEWWHYNGKLTASDGGKQRHFAYYVTLRILKNVHGQNPMLDVQVVDLDENKHYSDSTLLTEGSVSSDRLEILSKHFSLENEGKNYILKLSFLTKKGNVGLDLKLKPIKQPLYVSSEVPKPGQVDMGGNAKSFYYSITRLETEGELYLGNKRFVINPDSGLSRSWMDHQWGDFSMEQIIKNSQWIWMAIQLSDGTDINIHKFVPTDAEKMGEVMASISTPSGHSTYAIATITPNFQGNHYLKGYTLQIEDRFYELDYLPPMQTKNPLWLGVMSVNKKNIYEPHASFAIVEDTLSLSRKKL